MGFMNVGEINDILDKEVDGRPYSNVSSHHDEGRLDAID